MGSIQCLLELLVFNLVELGGIEPPSASDSPFALRPFPSLRISVSALPGQMDPKTTPPDLSPMSACFPAVSGLSLPSTTTSVARL